MTLSKKLKMTILAGVAGVGLAGVAATSALADYTRCDADGDRCYTVHTGYYDRDDYGYRSYYSGYNYYNNYGRHWVCDADGDRCHWSNYGYRYYDTPHVGFSVGF
jgi:hypothetical protein